MTSKYFYTKLIQEKELISSKELCNDIDNVLLEKLKNKLGNKCTKEGYIEEDSIKMIERSVGKIITSHFSGNIEYNVKLQVNTCNPSQGDIITCKVLGKNKIGIICKKNPLLIALSKIHHQDNLSMFESVKVNDTINVEVICTKFEFNDTEIHVIAKLHYN